MRLTLETERTSGLEEGKEKIQWGRTGNIKTQAGFESREVERDRRYASDWGRQLLVGEIYSEQSKEWLWSSIVTVTQNLKICFNRYPFERMGRGRGTVIFINGILRHCLTGTLRDCSVLWKTVPAFDIPVFYLIRARHWSYILMCTLMSSRKDTP